MRKQHIYTLLLIVPTIIQCSVNINLNPCDNEYLTYEGKDLKLITDEEMILFNLNDYTMKVGAKSYIGKVPDSLYIRNPTPWGDLYKQFDWPELRRKIEIGKTELLYFNMKPITLVTRHFINNSTRNNNLNAGIRQPVKNTIKVKWKEGDFKEFHDFIVNFTVKFDNFDDNVNIKLKWGEDYDGFYDTILGSGDGISTTLKPKDDYTAKLLAKKGVLKFEIDYMVRITGSIAVNFKNEFGGHHFWAVYSDDIMERAGLKHALWGRQVVTMQFYCEPWLEI